MNNNLMEITWEVVKSDKHLHEANVTTTVKIHPKKAERIFTEFTNNHSFNTSAEKTRERLKELAETIELTKERRC